MCLVFLMSLNFYYICFTARPIVVCFIVCVLTYYLLFFILSIDALLFFSNKVNFPTVGLIKEYLFLSLDKTFGRLIQNENNH